MFDRLFRSIVWKALIIVLLGLLFIAAAQAWIFMSASLQTFRELVRVQGPESAGALDNAIFWGKTAVFVLLLIGMAGVADLTISFFKARRFFEITRIVKRFAEGDLNVRAGRYRWRDVNDLSSAFNQMADTITGNMDRLKEIDALRRELVANVAHDLGGPVTSIRGYVETVLMKGAELEAAERERLLQVVLKNADALAKLVAELFDLSKLDANAVGVTMAPFSAKTVIQDVVSRFAHKAEERGVTLNAQAQEPCFVLGDAALIERAISNFVENSLNFTSRGGSVSVAASVKGSGLEFSIQDNGCGIPQADLPRIFERFYRVARDRSRSTGGSGLGLAIAKKILDAHGVTVGIESEVGKGTRIFFTLQLAGAPAGIPA